MRVKHECEKETKPDEWKDVMPRNCFSLVVQLSCFLSNFFDFLSAVFEICFFSLFLCVKANFGCSQFAVQNWKIPPQNGKLLLRCEKVNSKIILSLQIELIKCSVLIIYSDAWVICLDISPLVPLRPLVGLRPPSNSFILSFRLTITTASLPDLVQNTTPEGVLSLNAGALSLWHSPPQWAYGRVRVPRNLHSLFYNCPVLDHFPPDLYFSRCGWVHIGSLDSMLWTTIVSDGTSSIYHQASSDFSTEDRSNT